MIRVNQVVLNIKQSFKYVDPLLISFKKVESLNKNIVNILSHIDNYKKNRRPNYIDGMRNSTDKILELKSFFNIIKTPNDFEGVRENIGNFRKSVGQYYYNIKEEYKEVEDRYSEMKDQFHRLSEDINKQMDKLNKMETEIEKLRNDFSQKFINNQDKRNKNFEEFRSKINDEMKNRIKSFERRIDTIEDEFIKSKRKLEKKYDEEVDGYKNKLNKDQEEVLEELGKYKEKAIKIVGTIGSTGITGAYKESADYERNVSYVWHGISLVSIAILIIYSAVQFPEMLREFNNKFNWALLGWRVFITSAFGTMFAYASKQANKHANLSEKNRRMELELSSLGPYLAELDESRQHKIKEELSQELFGNGNEDFNIKNENDEVVTVPSNLFNLIIQILSGNKKI